MLAIPYEAAADAVAKLGDLGDRVLLDCTNPLQADLRSLSLEHVGSAGEEIAKLCGSSRVVKIFNTTGYNNMADPIYGGEPSVMFYAGGDAPSKQIAAALAEDIGFEAIDAGPLQNARLLESLAMLWIYLAVHQGHGREIAFRLVKR